MIQSIIVPIEIIADTYWACTHASHCLKSFNHHNCPASAAVILILQMRKPTQREVKQLLSGINQISGKDDIVTSSRFINRGEGKVKKGSRARVRAPEGSVVIVMGRFARGAKPRCEVPERLVISNPALWICTTIYLRRELYDKIVLRAVSFCSCLRWAIGVWWFFCFKFRLI